MLQQWHIVTTFVTELSIKGWKRAWHVAILTLTKWITHVLPYGKLLYEKSPIRQWHMAITFVREQSIKGLPCGMCGTPFLS